MDASRFVGKIAAFYPKPGAVKSGLPVSGAARYVGAVVGAKPSAPTKRGSIPDFELTIRGKSGRIATVSMVENYVNLFETWHEAASDAKP